MRGSRSIPGIVALGIRRVLGRLTGPTPGRTVVCVLGVAVAIGVLVVVTGLSLGLAGTTTVAGDDVNYWIVPEEEETGVTPLAYEGARLGSVHEVAASIAEDERVQSATPVALQPLRLENPETEERRYALAIGIVPSENGRSIAGMRTDALDADYPHYAGGSYDGPWTGELIASPAIADWLDVSAGDDLAAGQEGREMTVVEVGSEDPTVGVGEVGAVVVHLAELQTLTGTVEGDQADQILVETDGSDVESALADRYPKTSVVTRADLFSVSATPTDLPFAMALASGLVALGIGVAFVTTMMGLELTATRGSLAVLDAVGFSWGSVALLLAAETVTLVLLGGVLGVILGAVGIVAVNAGLADTVGLPAVATFDPTLAVYGLVTAVVVGVLSVGYPLYIARRTDTLGELSR